MKRPCYDADEVLVLSGQELLAAYDEVVLGHEHWEPYVWSADAPHEPCGTYLYACWHPGEHMRWREEETKRLIHNGKEPAEHSTDELIAYLQKRTEGTRFGVFMEYYYDDKWLVANKEPSCRDGKYAWNVWAPTLQEALYKACIISALGLSCPDQ